MKPPSEPDGAALAPAAGGDGVPSAGRAGERAGGRAAEQAGAPAAAEVPAAREARRVSLVRGGPMLVEGPVEVVLEDGRTERSDRFTVALCTCRRSRRFPWCDTSHRRRVRGAPEERRGAEHPGGPGGRDGSAGAGSGSPGAGRGTSAG